MKKIDAFLHLYLYQVETILNTKETELGNLKFQSEEANTDEYLKLFFKSFIETHNKLDEDTANKINILTSNLEYSLNISELSNYFISEVLLPADLSNKHKKVLRKQSSAMYTNPDLCLIISDGERLERVSVELKSTKSNKIPGSSVQQITPHGWVIFVKHNNKTTKVTSGKYINSITEKLPFPDRSPRPEIAFNHLHEWNIENRDLSNKVLTYTYNDNLERKEKMLNNWRLVLIEEWLATIKSKSRDKGEKWFNHAIRLYSIELLNYYETLPIEERFDFKSSINMLVDEFNASTLGEV